MATPTHEQIVKLVVLCIYSINGQTLIFELTGRRNSVTDGDCTVRQSGVLSDRGIMADDAVGKIAPAKITRQTKQTWGN